MKAKTAARAATAVTAGLLAMSPTVANAHEGIPKLHHIKTHHVLEGHKPHRIKVPKPKKVKVHKATKTKSGSSTKSKTTVHVAVDHTPGTFGVTKSGKTYYVDANGHREHCTTCGVGKGHGSHARKAKSQSVLDEILNWFESL